MCKYMNIIWKITKYKIFLEVYKVNLEYSEGVLPPKELGNCIDWRFTIGEDKNICNFFASWDKRKITNFKKNSKIIEEKINNITV